MIKGEQFLEVAGKLAARPTASEAEQRSAISRAYYGAFHLARAFLGVCKLRLRSEITTLSRIV